MEYKVKQSVLNCKKVSTAIERAKAELIKQPIHECFGQEYVRAIKDKFDIWEIEDVRKRNETIALIDNFDNWCMNYKEDDFDDINVEYIKKRLEEVGIVNGQLVDEDKLYNSPFIKQIMCDVEKLTR